MHWTLAAPCCFLSGCLYPAPPLSWLPSCWLPSCWLPSCWLHLLLAAFLLAKVETSNTATSGCGASHAEPALLAARARSRATTSWKVRRLPLRSPASRLWFLVNEKQDTVANFACAQILVTKLSGESRFKLRQGPRLGHLHFKRDARISHLRPEPHIGLLLVCHVNFPLNGIGRPCFSRKRSAMHFCTAFSSPSPANVLPC